VAIAPATFCVPLGARAAGEACGPEEDWCGAGLVCQYGRCRRRCEPATGRCVAGETCVDLSWQLGGQPFRFCLPACQLYTVAGCPTGESCAVVDTTAAGDALATCVPGVRGPTATFAACQPSADTYWGDCAPDHVCTEIFPGAPVCVPLCDGSTGGACADGQLCAADVFAPPFDPLGVCLQPCGVIGDATACPVQGHVCAFTGLFGRDARGTLLPTGLCGPGNHRTTGHPCTPFAELGVHDCSNGHVCAATAGMAPRCERLCSTAAGAFDWCRATGETCAPRVFSVEAGVGLCLPEI
jgi:hypothetical protein